MLFCAFRRVTEIQTEKNSAQVLELFPRWNFSSVSNIHSGNFEKAEHTVWITIAKRAVNKRSSVRRRASFIKNTNNSTYLIESVVVMLRHLHSKSE